MTETGSNREAAVLQILLPRLEAEGYEVTAAELEQLVAVTHLLLELTEPAGAA